MKQYRAKTALYSTTDPHGPDAAAGVVRVSPRVSGFQICGAGAVLDAALVERLCLQDSEYFEAHDAEEAAREWDARNRATHGTGGLGVAAEAGATGAEVALPILVRGGSGGGRSRAGAGD